MYTRSNINKGYKTFFIVYVIKSKYYSAEPKSIFMMLYCSINSGVHNSCGNKLGVNICRVGSVYWARKLALSALVSLLCWERVTKQLTRVLYLPWQSRMKLIMNMFMTKAWCVHINHKMENNNLSTTQSGLLTRRIRSINSQLLDIEEKGEEWEIHLCSIYCHYLWRRGYYT
jgi:hypothetical protein